MWAYIQAGTGVLTIWFLSLLCISSDPSEVIARGIFVCPIVYAIAWLKRQ